MTLDPRFLETAIEAAYQAGDLQMAQFGTAIQIEKKGMIDLVTEVDVAIERLFRALIGERFPDHGILGEEMQKEETPLPAGERPSHCWVFDPIDGTTNYAHGLPIFCVSIALEVHGRTEVGVVYDPTRRELFTAVRGEGARLNGALLKVSDASHLIDAMLVTGFPYDIHSRLDEIIGLFRAFVGRARAVRRLGSAALDLSYVAAGRLDGFWERGLHPWDVAAGTLLVEEAGGRVSDFEGGAFKSRHNALVASNGLIHREMLDTILGHFSSRS